MTANTLDSGHGTNDLIIYMQNEELNIRRGKLRH